MDEELKEEERVCSLCGRPFFGFGHNPEPLGRFEERCCDACNNGRVFPTRTRQPQGRFGLGKPSRPQPSDPERVQIDFRRN